MCRAHLRDRLVPDAAARHRVDRSVARRAAGILHGRHVFGQSGVVAVCVRVCAPPACVRCARARDRRTGPRPFGVDPTRRGRLRQRRAEWPGERAVPRGISRSSARPAHRSHGRDAAGDLALRDRDPGGGVMDGLLLRRQHRWCRARVLARWILSAARVRHRRGHVGCPLPQRGCRCARGRAVSVR